MSEVVVVGAGPGGSSAAYEAAQNKDHNVTIIEKRPVVGRPYQCAGGLSVPLIESHARHLMAMPGDLIRAKISRVVLKSPHEEAALEASDIGRGMVGLIVDRERFDQWLCGRALKAGAKLVRGKVTGVSIGEKPYDIMVDVYCDDVHRGTYDVVVGADGARSMVGKWTGIVDGIKPEDLHHGYQETINMPDYPQDTITLWWDTNYAPDGYVWAFPEGDGKVRLGNAISLQSFKDDGHAPDYYLREFKDANTDYNYNGNVSNITSGLLSTRPPMRSCVNRHGNVALVGCAAAHTSALHGGGILHAIIAGSELGRVIAANQPLRFYDARWKEKIGRRLGIHYKLKQMLIEYSNDDYDRLIRTLGGFKLTSGDVDVEVPRFLKHILQNDPKLLPEFIVGMLR